MGLRNDNEPKSKKTKTFPTQNERNGANFFHGTMNLTIIRSSNNL